MLEIITEKQARRFWLYVDRSAGQDSCWPWTKSTTTGGYGQFKIGRYVDGSVRQAKTHRISWVLHNGVSLPDELSGGGAKCIILHSCDNPMCCNPAHLRLGSYADNAADRVSRNRSNTSAGDDHYTRRRPGSAKSGDNHWSRMNPDAVSRGSANGSSKLTEDSVYQIRARADAGEPQRAIAADYNVTQSTVSEIVLRKTWKHLVPSQSGVSRVVSRKTGGGQCP